MHGLHAGLVLRGLGLQLGHLLKKSAACLALG
jgi:hypothetical protein